MLGAIIAKERFGFGQKVDVSHLGSMIWARGMQNGISLLTNEEFQRQDWKHAGNVLWNHYQCQDGEWIAFSMSQGDRYWPAFVSGLGTPELLEDERFSSMELRSENNEVLIEMLAETFKSRPREEWVTRMSEAGDLLWERVQRTLDLPNDPQVIENDYIIDFDHPILGQTKWVQTPVTYSKTPLSTRKMAPGHGENTEELLIDLLDYTWDDIASLQDDKVIL